MFVDGITKTAVSFKWVRGHVAGGVSSRTRGKPLTSQQKAALKHYFGARVGSGIPIGRLAAGLQDEAAAAYLADKGHGKRVVHQLGRILKKTANQFKLPGPRGGSKPLSMPTRITPTMRPGNAVNGLNGLTGAPAMEPFGRAIGGGFGKFHRKGLVSRTAVRRV